MEARIEIYPFSLKLLLSLYSLSRASHILSVLTLCICSSSHIYNVFPSSSVVFAVYFIIILAASTLLTNQKLEKYICLIPFTKKKPAH